ncbi:repressor [Desulfofustis limnaeus]|uniref:Repressor n=2 Tax=Desulfofustis limnaeus TaxID=2740163 RepID=A0ABM7W538_9BACT|nr:repressor [Desulfofustis limnaeus]
MVIAKETGYSIDWLLTGEGPPLREEAPTAPKSSIVSLPDQGDFDYIPMVEASLSAGGGAFVESEKVEGYYAFRKSWIKRVATSAKDLVLMRVIGDSMSPTIQARDTVMIDTARKQIKEGEIYAIRFDHTIMIKRLAFRPGGKILVISDNKKDYEPYEADTSDLNIIGQIIFFSRVFVTE